MKTSLSLKCQFIRQEGYYVEIILIDSLQQKMPSLRKENIEEEENCWAK